MLFKRTPKIYSEGIRSVDRGTVNNLGVADLQTCLGTVWISIKNFEFESEFSANIFVQMIAYKSELAKLR